MATHMRARCTPPLHRYHNPRRNLQRYHIAKDMRGIISAGKTLTRGRWMVEGWGSGGGSGSILWHFDETCLHKMPVKRQGSRDAQLSHHHK